VTYLQTFFFWGGGGGVVIINNYDTPVLSEFYKKKFLYGNKRTKSKKYSILNVKMFFFLRYILRNKPTITYDYIVGTFKI